MGSLKNETFKKIMKSNRTWILVGFLFALGIGGSIGSSNAKVPLEENKVTYDELNAKISNKENELAAINEEIESKKKEKAGIDKEKEATLNEIKKKQNEFDEAMEILKDKESILAEIKSSENTLSAKQTELENVEKTISARKDELAKVEKLIIEKQEAPIQLSAGKYYVGSDIPAGRYKAMPIGSGSNFVVYDHNGRLEVNTILGGRNGEPEYIFSVLDGAVIDSRSRAKLVPVE